MFTLDGHPGGLNTSCMAFAPRGRPVLASAGTDGVKVWDPQRRELLRIIDTEGQDCSSLAFAPDGERLVVPVGSQPTRIRVWEWATGRLEQEFNGGSMTHTAVFSPDGRTLAAGGHDRGSRRRPRYAVRSWNLATGRQRRPLPGHDDQVGFLAWSPGGELLASGGADGTVRLWDMSTRECRATFKHRTLVWAVAFSPDGRTLAMTGGRTIHLWDVATLKRKASLRGHTKAVFGLDFAPGGRTLASAGGDGLVRLWELPAARERAALRWDVGTLHNVAFAPDGMTAAVGAANGRIVVWDVDET
jgi:WD40 repeat protein